jgi:ElaB/YqjD/DUF883 family membrane-anchored ribosome-binding protein
MSTGKEYNELILDLLKEQGKDISDIKEDIAELKTAKHIVKDYKDWKGKVDEVWSPTQMKEVKNEVYTQKEQWTKTIGILIGVELVVGVILFFLK